jgi:hypothetical protein
VTEKDIILEMIMIQHLQSKDMDEALSTIAKESEIIPEVINHIRLRSFMFKKDFRKALLFVE